MELKVVGKGLVDHNDNVFAVQHFCMRASNEGTDPSRSQDRKTGDRHLRRGSLSSEPQRLQSGKMRQLIEGACLLYCIQGRP